LQLRKQQPKLTQTRRSRRGLVSRPARLTALGLALCLAWSLALSTPAQALASLHLTMPTLPTLRLNAMLLNLLNPAPFQPLGGGGTGGNLSTDGNGGPPLAWEGSGGQGGVDTVTGNKLTTLPLVSWTARGGLPVAFTLFHNSEGTHDAELGSKWTHSYDLWLVPASAPVTRKAATVKQINNDGVQPDVSGGSDTAVHWGNDLSYSFAPNGSGGFTAPTGYHDTLVSNGSPITSYDLTTPAQVRYHFTDPNGTGWMCTSISDENANTITLAYNASNLVTSVTDPTGRALTLAYDTSSRVHTVTDPLGRVWTLAYNTSNELSAVSLPAVGGSTYGYSYGYDSGADITSATDPRGYASTASYSSGGVTAWTADALGHETTYTYSGSYTTVTDPNSHATVDTFDSNGREVQEEDAAGYSEYTTYDTENDKTQVEDKRGYYWNDTYDGMGNVLTAKDPYSNTTTNTYNAHNKLLTSALPGGESTVSTYDADDNLTMAQQKNASGTVLATTSYTVSASTYGLVTAKVDPDSHTYTYGYDTNGDLTSLTTPLGRKTQWVCDALGTQTSREDAMSRTTSYTLDGWERVSTETYPDSSVKSFTYDADSNVTGFTDGTGTTTRTYDADDRLLSEAKGGSTIVSHAYDASGKLGLLSTTTDANGRVLTYAYTSRDQLASVSETSGTVSYGYDADGNETGIVNENETAVTKGYDEADHLSSVVNKSSSGTTLSSFSYAYNADSLRSTVTEADGSVVTYGYDGLLHLSSEVRTGTNPYSTTYVVDGAGQRTSETVGGATTTFTYDADAELTSTSGGFVNSYVYDLDGEQTSRKLSGVTTALTWDFDNQLTSAGSASFTYDATGRRMTRTAGGVTANFLYDGNEVLLERQGSTTTATYTYGNALVRKDGETPLFDGLGSERTVTNTSGAVQGTLTMTAFGQAVASTGSSTDPYEFAATSGYRNDGDAGLMLVGARYYDAQTGMFISRDTDLGEDPYIYCDGEPVNAIDSDGHSPTKKIYNHAIIQIVYSGFVANGTKTIDVWTPTPPPATAKKINSNPVNKTFKVGPETITVIGRIENWQ
jgi:RHS repeat-associated protein